MLGPLPGLGKRVCLRERLAESFVSVGDLPPGPLRIVDGARPAFLKAAEPVLYPRDQADGVGVAQVAGGEPDGCARCALEGEGDRCLPERSADLGGQRETAESARGRRAGAQAVNRGYLLFQELLEVLARFCALAVLAVANGHGERPRRGCPADGR